MVEAGLDFFFDMIKWVFNDFLIRIKLFDIPLLYFFLALILLGILLSTLLNIPTAGNFIFSSSNYRRRSENEEIRQSKLKSVRKGK